MHGGRVLLLALGWVVSTCGTTPPPPVPEFTDTWVWDGGNWTSFPSPETPPTPRESGVMAFDAAADEVVLFGGEDSLTNQFRNDTWTWDGHVWRQQHPAHSPEPRSSPGMTYDPKLKSLILVGGFTVKTLADKSTFLGTLDDVWAWDGLDWKMLGHTPVPMDFTLDASVAYDPTTGDVIAVADTIKQTFAWNGTTWTQTPMPQAWNALDLVFFDDSTQLVTAIGHFNVGNGDLRYNFLHWNGSAWDVGPTLPLPAELASYGFLNVAGMSYDPKRRQVVAFGGGCPDTSASSTWTFDGTAWSLQSPPRRPLPRLFAYLAFDPTVDGVVLFGGAPYAATVCG